MRNDILKPTDDRCRKSSFRPLEGEPTPNASGEMLINHGNGTFRTQGVIDVFQLHILTKSSWISCRYG
jgi:hypothetical protein